MMPFYTHVHGAARRMHTNSAALTVPRRAFRWYMQQFTHIVVVLFV